MEDWDGELPWEVIYKAQENHYCIKPVAGVGVGDIIRCRKCGTEWRVYKLERDDTWDSTVPSAPRWEKVRTHGDVYIRL